MKSIVYNGFTEWVADCWAWIKDFFNQPIPIIGVSLFFITIMILKIIATTAIGKKGLRKLRNEFNEFVEQVNNYLLDNEEKQENYRKENNEIIEFYKGELHKKDEQVKGLENLVLRISAENHNRNVKKLIQEYKEVKEDGGQE